MKKKSFVDLRNLKRDQLIDQVLLNTIKGGCCGGGSNPEVEDPTGCKTYTVYTSGSGSDIRMICDDDLE